MITSSVVNRMVAVADCRPHPQNYNRHDEAQVADLRLSLRKFSQVRSIVVQDDAAGGFLLVAGHGLWTAARAEGFAELRADVIPASWPPAKVLAYLAADNELGRASDPDEEQLAALAEMLQKEDPDLARLAAGSEERLTELLDGLVVEDEPIPPARVDEADLLRQQWGTVDGQLWEILGADGRVHRLLCGDSTVREDVERLLAGARPGLMVTDPPYGVEVDHSWRDQAGVQARQTKRGGQILGDDQADWAEVFDLFRPTVVYVWHASIHSAVVQDGLERVGYQVRQQIVWVKRNLTLSRSAYHWRHEPCFLATRNGEYLTRSFTRVYPLVRDRYRLSHSLAAYAVRKGKTAGWRGGRQQTTVWEFASPISAMSQSEEDAGLATLHPTQKPAGVYERPFRNHTRRGAAVADAFAGSGVFFIAAERTGRVGYGMEKDPRFVAVALQLATDFGLQTRLVAS